MLDTEEQWSRALASNNVRAILRWLRNLLAEGGDAEVDESLASFSSWVQRTAEFSKKELLTLCFSRCQGLWMFLDQGSFTRVHLLLQKLKNLLTLAQWGRRQLRLAHPWHGMGVPCLVCKGACGSSAVGQGCWNRERRALKQHIWLGSLVQWWGIMGLLPKYPEAQEMKRISQMWREMDHSHRRACRNTPGREEWGRERWSSLIQGMVAQVNKQLGPIWTCEDCTDQAYPPPNIQALLKLVLVPRIDNMSVQAILMYFVLDMANFLQCKDDLLQSFCHAFTIPPSFSQQIRGFWLLDHGQVQSSMELLLSPRSAGPWLSWQHRCILHSLLRRKQPHMALRYLLWTRPPMDGPLDLKLWVDVLLQNGHVSGAWALLRKGHKGSNDTVRYFLQTCQRLGLHADASTCKKTAVRKSEEHYGDGTECGEVGPSQLLGLSGTSSAVRPLCPFSAQLYQSQSFNTIGSDDVIRLFREAVTALRLPRPRKSEAVWPCEGPVRRQSCLSLSTQALRQLLPSPTPVDRPEGLTEEQTHTDDLEEEPPFRDDRTLCGKQTAQSPASTESPDSMSSFTSASCLPRLVWERPYLYGSTVTLQQISALLDSDGGMECLSTQEESRPRSADAPQGYPDLTLTLESATDPVFFNSLSKDSVEELVFTTDWAVEEILTCSNPGEEVLRMEEESEVVDQDLLLDKRPRSRLNLPPQFFSNEDNQSVPFVLEYQMDSHNFLTPDCDKLDYYKAVSAEIIHGPPNVTDVFSFPASESQSESVVPRTSSGTSQCFLELETLQRASDLPQIEEAVECFRRDSQDAVDQPEILTSCALTETTQDLLSELHHSLSLLEERTAGAGSPETAPGSALDGKQDSRGPGRYGRPFSLKDSSLHIPMHRSVQSRKLQIPGVPLSPRTSPTRTPQLSPSSSDTTSRERSPGGGKASAKKEAACFRSTSDRLGHCKLGSWWKQALETRRASTGLLPAIEQVPAITLEKRASLVPGRAYSHTLVTFLQSPAKHKGDKWEVKQAEKEEPAAHRAAGKAPHQRAEQGTAGQRGARTRRGKRVKKA